MRSLLVIILLGAIVSSGNAQQLDVPIYYNALNEEVPKGDAKAVQFAVFSKVNFGYEMKMKRMNGTVSGIGHFQSLMPLVRDGKFEFFDSAGVKTTELNYMLDSLHGNYLEFDSGKLIIKEKYRLGRKNGDAFTYFKNGSVRRYEKWKDNVMESGFCLSPTGDTVPYYPHSIKAAFPYGQDSLYRFLANNVKYPELERNNEIQGNVILQFVVNEDGSLSDPVIKKGLSKGLDNAVLQLFYLLPKYIPEQLEGVGVKTVMTYPILFRLH